MACRASWPLTITRCPICSGESGTVRRLRSGPRTVMTGSPLRLDVGEVLVRHGYPAPAGATLVELTTGLYRALHPTRYLPPPLP